MQQTTKMLVCLCPKSKGINLGVSLQHILLQNDQYKHLSNVSEMIFGSNLLVAKIVTITQVSSLNSIDGSFKMADPSETPITQGHPTTIFGKISVRKTIWELEFSEHLL